MKYKRGQDCSCSFFSKEDGGCMATGKCLINQQQEKIITREEGMILFNIAFRNPYNDFANKLKEFGIRIS